MCIWQGTHIQNIFKTTANQWEKRQVRQLNMKKLEKRLCYEGHAK